MKKIIRFLIALIVSPVLLFYFFLDWLYEEKTDYSWFKHIRFK